MLKKEAPWQRGGMLRLVAQGARGALVAQGMGLGLGYVLHVALAQWMDVVGYGIYTYVLAWTSVFTLFAAAGFPLSVVRFVPAYEAGQQWGLLRGFMRWSTQRVVLLGSVGALGFSLGAWGWASSSYRSTLVVGGGLILVNALFHLLSGMLKSVHRITLAHALTALRHVGVLVLGVLVVSIGGGLTPVVAVALTVAAISMAGLGCVPVLWRSLPAEVAATPPRYETTHWWRISLSLFGVGGFALVLHQTDLLMVGSLLGPEEAGLYAAASRTALLVNLIPFAIAAAADPMVARLHAQDDVPALQALTKATTRWAFGLALGVGGAVVLTGGWILLLFGEGFATAYPVLVVLAGGHVVQTAVGIAGSLLNLTGHQRISLYVFGGCALFNVLLNAVGIWLGGMMGAAIATVITTALLSLLLWGMARKHLHIDASVIAAWRSS